MKLDLPVSNHGKHVVSNQGFQDRKLPTLTVELNQVHLKLGARRSFQNVHHANHDHLNCLFISDRVDW